jgi:hypothetical protein
MKTFSERIFRELKIINDTKSNAKNIFSLTNSNFGENILIKIR